MSSTLSNPFEQPISNIGHLGIELGQPQGPGSRHIAIVFCIEGQPPRRCHLMWHHRLGGEQSNGMVQWISSGLGEITQRSIAHFCQKILSENTSENTKIAFGFSSILKSLDPVTGVYRPQKPGDGSTCATFVMEVFEALGVQLLRDKQWRPRKADKEWQQLIVETLIRYQADPTHIIELQKQCTGIRYRPEEVAAAVADSESAIPLSFSKASAEGAALLKHVMSFSYSRS